MIYSTELRIKLNEKSANHAIKGYGYCSRLREFLSEYKDGDKVSLLSYFFDSMECCKDCEELDGCKLLQAFGNFNDGAEWMLDNVSKNLAEMYILENGCLTK